MPLAFYVIFISIGILLIIAAVLGWEWIYGMWDAEFVRAVFGENAARFFCGACGLILVVMMIGYWTKIW